MLIEAHLAEPRESLQVPVPESFRGRRRDNEDESLHVTTQPAYYTADEISLIEGHILKLRYTQSLVLTGSKLIGNDPLLEASVKQIGEIEKAIGSGSTKILDDGSDRPLLDRVLILRENGFEGSAPEIVESLPEASSGRSTKAGSKATESAAA